MQLFARLRDLATSPAVKLWSSRSLLTLHGFTQHAGNDLPPLLADGRGRPVPRLRRLSCHGAVGLGHGPRAFGEGSPAAGRSISRHHPGCRDVSGCLGKTPNMWRHCLSKLQAKDRTHAAVIGVRRGLVIPERHGPQTSKTPEQRPGVMHESRTFQWQWSGEAAGVGTWGRTFQVWGGWFSWGT